MEKAGSTKAFCGQIFHFLSAPCSPDDTSCYQYYPHGLMVVESGIVKAVGPANVLLKTLPPDAEVVDYSDYLIMPGFIDTHIHYAQTETIASYGKQLLDWLEKYVFPAEGQYGDKAYAKNAADFFLKELMRNGTTTAAVYSTVHEVAADAMFESAAGLNMRIITGKTMMDRNAPSYLLDTPQTSYDESKRLIKKWHNKNRLSYAVTPRFAPTSSEAQLEVASALMSEFPTVYLQSHISENKNEVKWVQELFPWSKNYTDVYDRYNLLGKRSVYGHAVFFSEQEFQHFFDTETVCSWCPTSNFFLGSGLFNIGNAKKQNLRFGIGTDVGGGSSFSMLRTLDEAYKVAAIQGSALSPLEGFYHMTLGNAKALLLEHKIGNFHSGKEADFVVLDLFSTPLIANKMKRANNLVEKLFNLMILGDDRTVKATYIFGELKHLKDSNVNLK